MWFKGQKVTYRMRSFFRRSTVRIDCRRLEILEKYASMFIIEGGIASNDRKVLMVTRRKCGIFEARK